ncbi:MAG: glycosyltransferase family 4 protein [Planctomycetes bacterium]|nr:glycosyltransferase family 4 protein [Planctomycetota bacterium]
MIFGWIPDFGTHNLVRILFLNDLHDPRIGSSIRQMYQEGERLRELGHETALVSAVQDRALSTPTQIEGMDVFRLWSDYNVRFRGWRSLDNPSVREPLARVLAEWKPDVVHSHLLHTHLSYDALRAARESGAAVVFTAHDVMTFCYQKLTCFHGGEARGGRERDYEAYWQKCIPCQRLRWNPWRNAAIRKRLNRDVHRFTVVSNELGEAIRRNKIRVDRTIHNAVREQERLPDAQAVAAFRTRFGLEDKLVIAIAGRLHEQKGVHQLFKMLELLAPRFPNLRLILMGKRDLYETQFRAQAEQLGVASRIVTTGWLDGADLQCAYAATDVFATPSICFDTFGMVNLEAMEHSKPVVATEFGGSREVVVDGVTGFVRNPFDVEAFSEAIARLLADSALRARFGAAGHARLLERFTIERLTAEFLDEYQRALAARAAHEATVR